MFSFIVVSKDNLDELKATLESIVCQIDSQCDEIIVLDSSVSSSIEDYCQLVISNSKSTLKYIHQYPRGVFYAQNSAIAFAAKPFLCVINSGDYMLPNARINFIRCIRDYPDIAIHVFSQQFSDIIVKFKSTFRPSPVTFWPHQSIVYLKSIHSVMGSYPENYKYCADQVFFAKARKLFPFKVYSFPASYFNTNGISSGYSIVYMREIFDVYRLLDRSAFQSIIYAFVLPTLKFIIKPIIPRSLLQTLQAVLSRYRGLI